MCLAIYKPKGKTLKKSELEMAFGQNPDGAGYSYADQGKLITIKGFFDFAAFWKAFEHHKSVSAIVHFRLATHGDKSEANCHPWIVRDNLAMIHNGIIQIETAGQPLSDTGVFAEKILKPILAESPNLWQSPQFARLVQLAVGTSNKLVFMDGAGHHLIVNESGGHWRDGVWYSNMSYVESMESHWPSWVYHKSYRSSAKSTRFPDYLPEASNPEQDLAEKTEAEYWQQWHQWELSQQTDQQTETKWRKLYPPKSASKGRGSK